MTTYSKSITIGNREIPLVSFIKRLTWAMYIAGALGLSFPATRDLFQLLTPFNLLFTAFLVIYFQPQRNTPFWIFVALAAGLGFAAEVLGVATGFPFGDYTYGKTLGIKLFEVPLTIALNWLVLATVCGFLINKLKVHLVVKVTLAAALMVGLDILIEPVAIRYDFWSWAQGEPPLSNYLGWFGVAWIIQWGYFLLAFKKEHPLASHFFIIQTTFFTLCLILAKVI
ncbi:MAG: carotenoid biosynthesis protein [Bacteroidota bacterium]